MLKASGITLLKVRAYMYRQAGPQKSSDAKHSIEILLRFAAAYPDLREPSDKGTRHNYLST